MASIKKSKFSILRQPRVTEKSALVGTTSNCVVFDVHPRANKIEIKEAVEEIFDVKVKSIRTLNVLGKLKRKGNSIGMEKNWNCLLYTSPSPRD